MRRLAFSGPVLVREEKGYRVLNLQGATGLAIGGDRRAAAEYFLNAERNRKTKSGAGPDDGFMNGWIEDEELKDRTRLRSILDRACHDPYLRVREVAQTFAHRFGKTAHIIGSEAPDALLSDCTQSSRLFGTPQMSEDQLIDWVASWVSQGGPLLGKPTHYESRDGRF